MNKAYRLGQILKIIRAGRVHTQEELRAALAAEGVETTQASLSRDIRELGLVKTSQGYALPSAPAPTRTSPESVIAANLLDVRVAQHTLVLQTMPAFASPLAEALDQSGWPEIVGTIAGDNTVLIIAPDAAHARALERKLRELLS
jgi:transcriptional regulator of arginine metabolism